MIRNLPCQLQNQYNRQVVLQHVDEENAYLCGYLKIKNLTDEYPEMVNHIFSSN